MQVNTWLERRLTKVLDNAYEAAKAIRALENQYCQGLPITDDAEIGKTVYEYVRSLCDRKLITIRNNLTQFKINSFLLGRPLSDDTASASTLDDSSSVESVAAEVAAEAHAKAATDSAIAKLGFIESVISPYREADLTATISKPVAPIAPVQKTPSNKASKKAGASQPPMSASTPSSANAIAAQGTDPALMEAEIAATDVARPGLLGSFSMNRKQTAQYEQQVVQELRQWRQQSKRALRWLAILFIVPLLVAVLAKQLVFGPLLGNYSDTNPTAVQLNAEIRAEFAANLAEYKDELEIRELLKLTPVADAKDKQEKLVEKAAELWQEARNDELNGLKNVLADGSATLVFIGLVFFNRRRLTVIRSFSNRAFLSLSDPVKIFFFILVTDMFVGFHSAEGWDAILSVLTRHFGLPERPNAINIFIATVPVIMDSCIKFWIFNYLTRFSPSSSAILERMNT